MHAQGEHANATRKGREAILQTPLASKTFVYLYYANNLLKCTLF